MKDALKGPWSLEYCDGWRVDGPDGESICDIGGFGADEEENERLHSIGQAIEALPDMVNALVMADCRLSAILDDKELPIHRSARGVIQNALDEIQAALVAAGRKQ
jgi:hypothetical protein